MGGGERRSTNEWWLEGDVRSRSNRNVGTPGAEECEDTRRAELGKTQDFLIFWVGFFGFIGFLVGLNPNGPRTTRLVDNGVGNFHGD
jgi:hypothetical protein